MNTCSNFRETASVLVISRNLKKQASTLWSLLHMPPRKVFLPLKASVKPKLTRSWYSNSLSLQLTNPFKFLILGWSCEARTDGLHHGHRVPPKAGWDHPGHNRIERAWQASRRWHWNWEHHGNIWRVPNWQDSAVSHSCRYVSGTMMHLPKNLFTNEHSKLAASYWSRRRRGQMPVHRYGGYVPSGKVARRRRALRIVRLRCPG